MVGVSIPTEAQLPGHLRIDCSNSTVQKSLSRLSRSSLLTLAVGWVSGSPSPLLSPRLLGYRLREGSYLVDSDDEDEVGDEFGDVAFMPARSLEQLQEIYEQMQSRKGPKSEVLGRITECDWKHGISLYQLAMADFQYLIECPLALKWNAYRVAPVKTLSEDADVEDPMEVDNESTAVPTLHASSFLRSIQAQALPDVKAHYCFDRPGTLPLMLLRILILDSPYNTGLGLESRDGKAGPIDSSRVIYAAFPDASPYVYISKAQTGVAFRPGDARSLHNHIMEGIPKALSRPRERFTLRALDFSTRNLAELVERKGPNRTNRAGGGWSFYSDKKKHDSPLVTLLPTPPLSDDSSDAPPARTTRKRALSPISQRDERLAKRAKLVAKARFGNSNHMDDGKGVERLDVAIHDPVPQASTAVGEVQNDDDVSSFRRSTRSRAGRRSDIEAVLERERDNIEPAEDEFDTEETWRPEIKVTFHGSHVFAGIRQLIEHGVIDGERMPGWMTGQEGVTVGVIRHGRIQGSRV